MSLFSGLESIVETDYPLADHTWYGIGGPAQYFVRPQSVEQLSEVVRRCHEHGVPLRVLGYGSNLLIADKGVPGAVVKLEAEAFQQVEFHADGATAGAGVELNAVVLETVKRGLSGLEVLSGIPGTIGGAVRMNAGGHFGDIGTAVDQVTLMDNHGAVFTKAKPELVFDYRSTNIAVKIVLAAHLNLTSADPEQIMRSVQETWIHKKNHQPLHTRNCGCIFKNPPGQSAGALIDRAGLKGLTLGGAKVSEKHANFILAAPGCTSADVLRLIEVVRERVAEQFGVTLETEIEIWP